MHIIIHIGRHKTGTTFLQHELVRNASRLRSDADVVYATAGRHTERHYHHPLFKPLVERRERLDPSIVAHLEQEAEEAGGHRVLVSSEVLSRWEVDRRTVELLAESLRGHEVTLVVYLRRQDSFLESLFAERITRGLLAAPQGIHDIEVELDYARFLAPWEHTFGADAIRVRSFDRAVSSGLLADFLRTINVDPSGFPPSRESRTNSRPPWSYLEVLRFANRSDGARRKIYSTRIKDRLGGWGVHTLLDHPRPLSERERAEMRQRCAASNAEVARRFLGEETLFDE